MNYHDELAQHLHPLAAPLPAPSFAALVARRPRIDAEAIEAMAAARVTPMPMRLVSSTTPIGGKSHARALLLDEVDNGQGLTPSPEPRLCWPCLAVWGFVFAWGLVAAAYATHPIWMELIK